MIPIKVANLTKVYRRSERAVDNLSFEVRSGSIAGFVGRNGAGKTTTINVLAGVIKPTAGEIHILDMPVKPGDWKYKSRLGFVLERPSYLDNLTGREYLQFAGLMQKIRGDEARKRIDELLEFLELKNETRKPIKEYSKGMKKKISLAAALIHDPQLLILDEPLEGMDPVSASQTKKLLRSLAEKGKAVFISSHELGTVQSISDNLVIIDSGKMVFQGTLHELKEKIGTPENDGRDLNLEELFVKLIGEDREKKGLSWL